MLTRLRASLSYRSSHPVCRIPLPGKPTILERRAPDGTDGRTATSTPQFNLAHARHQPVALHYGDQAPRKSEHDREQAAWSRMTSTISLGATKTSRTDSRDGGRPINTARPGIPKVRSPVRSPNYWRARSRCTDAPDSERQISGTKSQLIICSVTIFMTSPKG